MHPLRQLRTLATGRRGWALAGAVLAVVAVVGGLARIQVDTGIDSFLPRNDATYKALQEKARSFGGDPVIVILETREPRTLFLDSDQLMRLVRLEGDLAALPDVAAVYGPGTVLNQTAGAAQDMLAQISGRRDGLRKTVVTAARKDGASAALAKRAGDVAIAAFDKRYGALLVRGLPAGLPTVRNGRFVQTVLFEENGNPRPQWHFVVPSATSAAVLVRPREGIDQAAASRLSASVRSAVDRAGLTTSRATVTGVPVITSALTDRAQHELPVLGAVSVLAVSLVFLLAPWSRRRRSRLRPTFAALSGTAATVALFGWLDHPLSLGVVAFLPILLGIGSDFPFYLSRTGHDRRVLVAAAAAVVGFGSLMISPLPFVRELGLALALGITFTVAVAGLLRVLLGPVLVDEPELRAPTGSAPVPPYRRALIGLAAVGFAAVGWVALPNLPVQAQPEELAQGLPQLAEARYAEKVLGSTGEVNVVLSGPNVASPEVLAWSRDAGNRIVRELGDRVHPIITLADLFRFLGAEPTQDQIDAATQVMPRYLTSAVLRSDATTGVMIYGVEFDDVEALGHLLDQVRAELGTPPAGVRAELVGLPVAAVRGLDLVSGGRLWMNLAGVLAAGLVLLVGLRSRRDALRAVLTVVLATGWVTALAAATTGSLSPLTVAIGSLTTATGCEFAVMLGRTDRGTALRNVATAAAAGTIGYAVLALSDLAVLRDFGLLLAASVVCSFAAAVVVTGVLLPSRPLREPAAAEVAPTRQEVLV